MGPYCISRRITLRAGDHFRVVVGPSFTDEDGQRHLMPLRGVSQLAVVVGNPSRIHLDCREVIPYRHGVHRTLLVEGKPYLSETGITIHPFRMKRLHPDRSRRPRCRSQC